LGSGDLTEFALSNELSRTEQETHTFHVNPQIALDAMGHTQDLCIHRPNLFLDQLIQPLKGSLNVVLARRLLDEYHYDTLSHGR
jgi:hypothetical protein